MFGAILQCSECKLEFATGWNHHGPGIDLLCQDCGCALHARGAGNVFGAEPGEECNLLRWDAENDEWVDTGCRPTVTAGNLQEDYGIIYEFAGCICPGCGGANLTAAIRVSGNCPRCKKGVFEKTGSAIY
jgi:hypothetical protein